jgi:DNA-binding LacI/PurR family transcriptional regulator
LILSPVQLDREEVQNRTSDTPVVLIGEQVYDVGYDPFAIDNVAASHASMQHLLGLGQRGIAFIGVQADEHRQSAQLRLRGYREALAAAGIEPDPALVVTATSRRAVSPPPRSPPCHRTRRASPAGPSPVSWNGWTAAGRGPARRSACPSR